MGAKVCVCMKESVIECENGGEDVCAKKRFQASYDASALKFFLQWDRNHV